ncbi:hypothetical protein K4K59_005164 [Colletotrichum sp. SAR11_240]|nr:hypothetical protein K4K59_005164 [Colletotrichum sp. SAR11_240]
MPSHPNHLIAGQKMYTTGQLQAMRDLVQQARKTEEFPNTTSIVEDPKNIVEDYQLLQRLRDVRGDPALPPPQKYNKFKIEIARRIKTRDEAEGGSTKLEEMDNRVQSWMGSINKEARMLEITQAALQRKGISNPTQADLDAIAEEFMQIAERTLLDVANPLRMNATRMEGNISRFDNQLNGLSDLNSAVNTSMSAQVNTLNTVLTNLQNNMSTAVGVSAEAMSTNINTLNTILTAQSSTFNGSLNMLNTSLNTVTGITNFLFNPSPTTLEFANQTSTTQYTTSLGVQSLNTTTMAPEKPVLKATVSSRSATENHRASSKQNKALEKAEIPATTKSNKDSGVDKKTTNRPSPPPRRPATHQLPSEEQKKANGRYTGRKLVQWNRQPVAEKFLLALAFECEMKGIELPWDEAAHRFRPNVTGNAARQYVTKMSKRHLEEGRVVPPRGELRRFDNRETRGVVLDKDTGEPRAVFWDEDVDEPDKFPVDEQTVTIEEEEDAAAALAQASHLPSF